MSLLQNIVQIVLTVIFGFCMVLVFYRGGSRWPCIITHGLFIRLEQSSETVIFITGGYPGSLSFSC